MAKKMRSMTVACLMMGVASMWSTSATAQATRTWVSGTGDDVNPCSRTAPCKTFAGAISKTAAGGEINCMDPAGYGAVTITKSLTIDCHFTEGGVLASGNGIVVNALSSDNVILRGLDIFGVSPPSNGIRILVANSVTIEDCTIRNFNAAGSYGISMANSVPTLLNVTNTHVTSNGGASAGGGILIQPTGSGLARVQLDDVLINNNVNGVVADSSGTSGGVFFVLNRTTVSGNSGTGLSANAGGAVTTGMVRDSVFSYNAASGITASGANSVLRVSNSTFHNNSYVAGAAINPSGGSIISYGDNIDDANTNNGAFSGAISPKK